MAGEFPHIPPDLERESADNTGGWSRRLTALRSARLSMGQALLILLALIGLGAALGLIFAANSGEKLDAEGPALVVDSVLSVTLEGSTAVRVHVDQMPVDEVFGPDSAKRWAVARAALPDSLTPVSPLYRVTIRGRGPILLHFSPSTAASPDAEGPDVYMWDSHSGTWQFVSVTPDAGTGGLLAGPVSGPVGLFSTVAAVPQIGVTVGPASQPGDVPAAMVFAEGVTAQADGSFDVGLPATSDLPGSGAQALAVIHMSDDDALRALLDHQAARDTFVHQAGVLLQEPGWAGVLLDLGPIGTSDRETTSQFVERLARQVHRSGKLLAVRVPTPATDGEAWDTGGYDWARIGTAADRVLVTPPGTPGAYYTGGTVDDFLGWATTQVSRLKLAVAFSALSADEFNGQAAPISFEYALAPLGTVSLELGGLDSALKPEPGQALSFDLVGQATGLGPDPTSGMYRYDVYAGDGQHRIWLMTASALRRQLDWLAARGVRTIVIDGLLSGTASPQALTAVSEFAAGQPPSVAQGMGLHWQVKDSGGTVLFETHTDLGAPLIWTPDKAGEYVVSAEMTGETASQRGAAAVLVSEHEETPAVSTGPLTAAVPLPAIPEGMPAPISPPGVAAFGRFELGGQVNQDLRRPDLFQRSGMTWVKFQLVWQPGQTANTIQNSISQAHSQGLKALISITGGWKFPTDINYDEFVKFLKNVAYYGPDAIEVWNEPNYYFEWPQGQIDGGTYVQKMLAPAYNAIKSVNPNIMVISGAPLPTGLYYGEGGCSAQGFGCDDWYYLQQMAKMGAANYMDCVGVHYNTGATSPSATTGHPADPGYHHYSWYFGSMLQLYGGMFGHPVCFTELGYLSPQGYGGLPANFSWAQGTTVAEQAAWLAEAATLSRQSGQVRLMIVWNVDFTDWGGNDPKGGYAILRPDGSCPACDALGNVMPKR